MATALFTAEPLIEGTTMASAEITDVGDIVIDVDLANIVNSGQKELEFLLKVHEGTNSYKALTDNDDRIIQWKTRESSFRKKIEGIDTEKAKLYVNVPAGYSGNMTVVYNKTANAIPSA